MMRREDCRIDCVGPDCEGCRKFVLLSSDAVLGEVMAKIEEESWWNDAGINVVMLDDVKEILSHYFI